MTLLTLFVTMIGGPAAAAFPDRPVTLIVPFAAGGSTDVTARMIAPYIEKNLHAGARVVVSNIQGGGGDVGFATISGAIPDGHTIGFINTPSFLTIPLERQARFDPKLFDPLVAIVDDPSTVVVPAGSAIATPVDLVAFARTTPQKASFATTGVGSDEQLSMLKLQELGGVRFVHIPFPGGAHIYRALRNGNVMVAGMNLSEALRAREEGRITILGQMSRNRHPVAPDLPTFREMGFDIAMGAMRGIAAPRGLPDDVRQVLVDAITAAAADPDFQAKAKATYQPLRILGPDAFADELTAMDRDYRALWAVSPWSDR
ncbi:tripartite tricarboxylate transporter substrate binding protein [Azospirillum oleiclasticum]|nr:tripartite tricarboxylate transporter substrate binding protein [Azospirillum oleiclasticum]